MGESFVLDGGSAEQYRICEQVKEAVLAAIRHKNDAERWTNAGTILGRIAADGNPDIAVSLARDWIKMKPEGASPDVAVLSTFIPLLKEAKLL